MPSLCYYVGNRLKHGPNHQHFKSDSLGRYILVFKKAFVLQLKEYDAGGMVTITSWMNVLVNPSVFTFFCSTIIQGRYLEKCISYFCRITYVNTLNRTW